MNVCPDCGKVVGDLGKHRRRGRCYRKGPISEKERIKRW